MQSFERRNMKRTTGWLAMLCLVAACGGSPDQGPPLGPFAAISKTVADAPFNIVPPSSKSPVPFTYTSSKPEVATIAGSLVTIKGPGETTITASQAADGQWGPTSASTTLTVTACVPPATLSGSQCLLATGGATLVHANGKAWMGVSFTDTWSRAREFCATSTIEGVKGWSQPTADDLKALQAANVLAGRGWTLGPTWSSTQGANAASHVTVDLSLSSAARAEPGDTATAFVSCVR
jgi:hypothetical protein